jgi:ribosome-associated translation inhibitor RaiA
MMPVEITFRHMEPSPTLEARIRQRAAELDQFFDRITATRVVIECRHPRQHQGKLFEVVVDLKLPGSEIVVGRDPGMNHAHEDAHVAVRDAFDAARRQLEDYARKRRGDVKHHATTAGPNSSNL